MVLAKLLHKSIEEIMALSTDEIILWAAFLELKNGK
jgi:hypothetical protein